jgi:hypothetical protein
MTEGAARTYDGTIGYAKRVVEEWREAKADRACNALGARWLIVFA